MSKHLSNRELNKIVKIISIWNGKLTWEELCKAVATEIGRTVTRQSLSSHEMITDAYRLKKALVKEKRTPLRKPANLNVAAQRILSLETQLEIIKKQNNRYKEQFTRWQYNSYKYGVNESQLNESLSVK